MNKKYIVSGIMLIALTATLVSCKARSEYGKIYVARENETYVLVTDESGDTVVNEEGNLLSIQMRQHNQPHHDTDGNLITEEISYPKFIDEGKKIDCRYYKIKIPSGWKNTGTVSMQMSNEKLNAAIDFANDSEKTYDELVSEADEFIEKIKESGLTVESGTVKILDTDCMYTTVINNESEDVLTTYFLDHNDHVYKFMCTYKKDNIGKIDFISVLNGIEFK